jgi:hypothetical protein
MASGNTRRECAGEIIAEGKEKHINIEAKAAISVTQQNSS